MEKLIMLGTGNAMCTRCYNTCFYLSTPGGGLMVDAGGGNGIFRQLHKAHLQIENIRHLIVTHAHTDHILGVIWLIRKISPMIHKGRYQAPFTIYCHEGVKHAIEVMCSLMLPRKIGKALGDTIVLREVTDGETLNVSDVRVTFFDTCSTKLKQFGFSAVLPSGQRLTCLGDEPYNEHEHAYVNDADWLLCEAFCLNKDQDIFRPYEKNHSTALDAGRLAGQLGVKNLLLYHTEDTGLATRKSTYSAEAKSVFAGNVYVPDDLDVVDLALRNPFDREACMHCTDEDLLEEMIAQGTKAIASCKDFAEKQHRRFELATFCERSGDTCRAAELFGDILFAANSHDVKMAIGDNSTADNMLGQAYRSLARLAGSSDECTWETASQLFADLRQNLNID